MWECKTCSDMVILLLYKSWFSLYKLNFCFLNLKYGVKTIWGLRALCVEVGSYCRTYRLDSTEYNGSFCIVNVLLLDWFELFLHECVVLFLLVPAADYILKEDQAVDGTVDDQFTMSLSECQQYCYDHPDCGVLTYVDSSQTCYIYHQEFSEIVLTPFGDANTYQVNITTVSGRCILRCTEFNYVKYEQL